MVGNICDKCGLPKELCICEIIDREGQKIKVYVTRRKYRKPVTIVEGINKESAKGTLKKLKKKIQIMMP